MLSPDGSRVTSMDYRCELSSTWASLRSASREAVTSDCSAVKSGPCCVSLVVMETTYRINEKSETMGREGTTRESGTLRASPLNRDFSAALLPTFGCAEFDIEQLRRAQKTFGY